MMRSQFENELMEMAQDGGLVFEIHGHWGNTGTYVFKVAKAGSDVVIARIDYSWQSGYVTFDTETSPVKLPKGMVRLDGDDRDIKAVLTTLRVNCGAAVGHQIKPSKATAAAKTAGQKMKCTLGQRAVFQKIENELADIRKEGYALNEYSTVKLVGVGQLVCQLIAACKGTGGIKKELRATIHLFDVMELDSKPRT